MKIEQFILGVLGNNSYVVSQDGYCLIIDPTYDADKTIETYVETAQLKPIAILATHGHFDHIGGAEKLKEKYNIPIYLHQNDFSLASTASENVYGIVCENCFATDSVKSELHLSPFVIQVLETPGHTGGSVCYIVDDAIFTGDTLFFDSIGRTDFAESDNSKMLCSLRKLKSLKQDFNLYAGHGRNSTLERETRHNIYLKQL